MADLRQTTIGPEDLGPQDVFVINDISLTIPPTNISVRKEDLTYQWRTLRTKSATKIPTGHGQVTAHLSIPFTSTQFLSLHRLITQFRHSPFCYVDNRYLRESIVPEWPYHQNMAFTMTNIHLAPYPGSSDTWIVELDLVWFNYAPFMHNYLFREDWNTKAILGESTLETPNVYYYTIGWNLNRDTYERTSSPTIVSRGPGTAAMGAAQNNNAGKSLFDSLSTDAPPSPSLSQKWDVTKGLYQDKSKKTLYDMQVAHAGIEFDLLPIPGNMAQARPVPQPRNSRIYTRYINLLQRDALWKHFEIDVEEDLLNHIYPADEVQVNGAPVGPNRNLNLWDAFFSSTDSVNPTTHGLHSGIVPRSLRYRWINKMREHNHGVRFVFNSYQDIKLPKTLTDSMDESRRAVIARISELANLPGSDELLEVYGDGDGTATIVSGQRVQPIYQEQKRKGYYLPLDKHIPIGTSIENMLSLISRSKKYGTQTVRVRSEEEIRHLYRKSPKVAESRIPGKVYESGRHSRIHYGTDFGGDVGDPVFAVAGGVVSYIALGANGDGVRWVSYDVEGGHRNNIGTGQIEEGEDFYESVKAVGLSIDEELARSNRSVKLVGNEYNRAGTYIPSKRWPGRLYYLAEYGAGGLQLTITHDDDSQSKYMHLDSYPTDIVYGARVDPGQPVAFLGETSPFSDSYLKRYFRTRTSINSDEEFTINPVQLDLVDQLPFGRLDPGVDSEDFSLASHLHFEYWESRTVTDPQDIGPVEAFAPTDDFGGNRHRVVTDIKWSYELAKDHSKKTIDEIVLPQQTIDVQQEEVIENLVDEGTIDSEVGVALLDLFNLLEADGWKYYDKDTTIVNVWQKVFSVTIAHSGADLITGILADPQQYLNEGAILVNVSGQLSHIVANLPILSHEFPTQQHLGSVEPSYNFSFAILDDQSSLDGVSTVGTFLEGMRSILQHNARKFRPIADGWCVSTDTFITRMLGSFYGRDVLADRSGESIVDFRLKKRTLISRSTSQTVEGHPGLSMMALTLEETNPYETEVLTATAPQKEEVEEAYKLILNALLKLKFIEKYQKNLFSTMIAQLAGGHTRPGVEGFGKFELEVYNEHIDYNAYAQAANVTGYIDISAPLGGNQDVFLRSFEGQQYLMIRAADGEAMKDVYEQMLPEGQSYDQTLWEADSGTTYIRLPLSALDEDLLDYQTGETGLLSADNVGELVVDSVKAAIGGSTVANQFDMTEFFEEDPTLAEIPFAKIRDYYIMLVETIKTAERMLVESEVGGISNAEISEALYCLPVNAHMWQSWQAYLEGFVISEGSSLNGRTALQDLQSTTNYPTPAGRGNSFHNEINAGGTTNGGWLVALDDQVQSDLKAIMPGHTWAAWTGAANQPMNVLFGYLTTLIGSSISSNIDPTTMWHGFHSTAISRLVNAYMNEFPYVVSLPEWLKSKYDSLLGDILGNLTDDQGRVGAFQNTYDAFRGNAYSCGNIRASMATGNPYWVVDPFDTFVLNRTANGDVETGNLIETRRGGFLGGVDIGPLLIPNVALSQIEQQLGIPVATGKESAMSSTLQFADWLSGSDPDNNWEDYLYPKQTIGAPLNSPFEYPSNRDAEQGKLRYLAQVLARMAEDILADPGILRAFGLEHLGLIDRRGKIVGSECYPDMDLPFHPYYGDEFQTSPDFYMWNIYEDGGAFGTEDQELIYKSVDAIVQNCYDSLHRVQQGIGHDTSTDQVIQEPGLGDKILIQTQMLPEGTDYKHPQDGSGPSTTPWATNRAGAPFDNKFQEAVGEIGGPGGVSTAEQKLTGKNPKSMRIAQHEGSFGRGAGVHYHKRGDDAVYQHLRDRLVKEESMFGSQAGFLNQRINPITAFEIDGDLKGTNLEPPIEDSHTYSPEALKQLARDSSKDMLSYKMSMRRAYPTFKLFFVEEDQDEGRFLNFDDFYTYNAVKEFSIVMSRKMPADHAVIVIQNVSGTLDGTKRNVIADLDYFDKTAEKKLEAGVDEGTNLSGDPRFKNTAQEQPFGSLVLRPGMNVQLRCGYSNDPDNLHVMVSGRVVDLSWNKTGDLAEIMVQSFGTELIQAIKGTHRDGQGATYYTTHELLGSLMLEPEVVHFGRWAFGQLFQAGENSDYRLDFHDYSREGFMGRFRVTNWMTQWVVSHPGTVFAATLGVTALSLIPGGGGLVGKAGGKILPWLKIAPGRGTTGWTKILGKVTKNTGRLLPGQREAVAKAAIAGFKPLLNAAGKSSKEFAVILAKRQSKLLRLLMKDGMTSKRAASLILKHETYLQTAAFKGMWMSKPWVSGGLIETLGAVGFKPFGTAFSTYLFSSIKAGAAAAVIGLSADLLLETALQPLYDNTVDKVRKFFQTKQAHMFLSPQDDNLYPPHPKDYMRGHEGTDFLWFKFPTLSQTAETVATLGARIVVNTDQASVDFGSFVGRLIDPDKFITKKVEAEACQYQLTSTTTWDVFHEMSLRHPGWIYGPRPYGTEFRYTMFFGPPAQRYWSKPASNRFIQRANDLRRYLGTRGADASPDQTFDISKQEFEFLYGQEVYEQVQESIREDVEAGLRASTYEVENEFSLQRHKLDSEKLQFHPDAIEQELAQRESKVLTSIAMKEYLRSLEIRFTPFRRYHMFTSDRDIIWNGIMSSEQAVINAVDVNYFAVASNSNDIQTFATGSALFKAHSFIPEHMLRVAPVEYPNCKGYDMAMRYGMGSLLHSMRDMYRGEILLLGNPRIRPWDIGILVDTYNDMVGPVEIEQVVHTMSHETGFVTEIKPSAVVFANEISGWPMVEAMKMFAMAVRDIEGRYAGIRSGDKTAAQLQGETGALGIDAARADYLLSGGEKWNSFIEQKYRDLFPGGADLNSDVFGGTPPNTKALDSTVSDIVRDSFVGMGILGALTTLSGTVVGVGEVVGAQVERGLAQEFAGSSKSLIKTLIKQPKAVAAGAAIVAGVGLVGAAGRGSYLQANGVMDFPSLVWLAGGPLLFLQMMRNEAVICVPLMKNGQPVVSGLSFQDPGLVWNQFRGNINRWATDTISGTTDMIQMWNREGSALWKSATDSNLSARTGERDYANSNGQF